MEKKGLIKNIEFLRFIGVLSLVFFNLAHLKGGLCFAFIKKIPLYKDLFANTAFAGHWIDFFFVISGFLFFLLTDFKMDFLNFVKKKIIRLLPVIWFAVFVYMVLSWFDILNYRSYVNIFTMFLINNVGLSIGKDLGNLHHLSFISALFWGFLFFFYLKKLIDEKWFNFVTAIITLFSYTFVLHTSKSVTYLFYHFINTGLLRAIGGLGLGYFIFLLYRKFKESNCKIQAKQGILISLAEIFLFCFIINFTLIQKFDFDNWIILLFAFCLLFGLFLIKEGFLSKLCSNNISVFLGRYSYSIFVMHLIVLDLFKEELWRGAHRDYVINYPELNIMIYMLTAILVGMLTYHLVEKPAKTYLTNRWLKEDKE